MKFKALVLAGCVLVGILFTATKASACTLNGVFGPSSVAYGNTASISWSGGFWPGRTAGSADVFAPGVYSSVYTQTYTNAVSGSFSGSYNTGVWTKSPGNYTYSVSCSDNPPMTGDSKSVTITQLAPATISVNSCPQGGSWSINPGGYSGNSATVGAESGGRTYSISYSPPANHTVSISPASSQTVFPGGSATFTVTCTPISSPCPADKTETLNCPDGSGTYTKTTTYSGAACTETVTDNKSSQCSGGPVSCPDPAFQTRSTNCASGVGGPITERRDRAGYPGCGWGDWYYVSGSCGSAPPPPGSCTPPTSETRTRNCSAGLSGTITEVRYKNAYPDCSWGNWLYLSGSCVAMPAPASITVNNNTSGNWSINGIPGSGTQAITVNPIFGGTPYTITPSAVSGYNPPTITNSVSGSGPTMNVLPGGSESFTLNYSVAPPSFNYTLTHNGDITIMKGGIPSSRNVTITRNLTSGSSQDVDLSVSGVPAGIAYAPFTLNPCSPTCSSVLRFTVNSGSPVGTFPITVTGSPLGRTTTFDLTVQNSPNLIVTCSASPASGAKVGNTVTWSSTVSGGVPPYRTYAWTGTNVPTGASTPSTPSFGMSYSTVGLKTAQVTVTDDLGNTATCSPAASTYISFNPDFEEI